MFNRYGIVSQGESIVVLGKRRTVLENLIKNTRDLVVRRIDRSPGMARKPPAGLPKVFQRPGMNRILFRQPL